MNEDSITILVLVVCMTVSFFCGYGLENTSINNDCKNLGHSYTDKYYLNCGVKK